MTLETRIREVLDDIGLREIAVRASGNGDADGRFRATCTAPVRDGRISSAVQVEKLTWMSLPGGGELRIQELEVEDRTEEALRIAMELRAERPAATA